MHRQDGLSFSPELHTYSSWSRMLSGSGSEQAAKTNSNLPGKLQHGVSVEPAGHATASLHLEHVCSMLEWQENQQG